MRRFRGAPEDVGFGDIVLHAVSCDAPAALALASGSRPSAGLETLEPAGLGVGVRDT
jgi:hypothetical protein